MDLFTISLILKYGLTTSAIALGVLWLLFKFYFVEYEMDAKSLIALSLKTFGTFIVINFAFLFWLPLFANIIPPFILSIAVALFIARRLFMKAGAEKKEAWKVAVTWVAIMTGIAVWYMSYRGFI